MEEYLGSHLLTHTTDRRVGGSGVNDTPYALHYSTIQQQHAM